VRSRSAGTEGTLRSITVVPPAATVPSAATVWPTCTSTFITAATSSATTVWLMPPIVGFAGEPLR